MYHTLDLHFNHLQGRISNEIGNLSSLVSLLLPDNNLRGRLPNGLDLSGNGLEGQLPNAIGNLTSLDALTYKIMNLLGGYRARWEIYAT